MTAPKRPLVFATIAWLGLIAAATALGGFSSLFTGKVTELPKWNGWSYLVFCAREGAMLGTVLALPLALITFLFAWGGSRRSKR